MFGRDIIKTVVLAALIIAVFLFLPGCTTLDNLIGPTVARATKNYCEQVTPEARAVIRNDVNKTASPNAVRVCCASDPGGITACTAP